MYTNQIHDTINHALPALLEKLALEGAEVGSRQGSRTQELNHVGITLLHPRERYITLRGRKVNLAAQIAETMWVLSGRDDIAWLSNYLPRAADFSDDGLTWRGGYGTRLRNWEGVDQIHRLYELLKEDPITRRAVAVIYDPARDLPGTGNRGFKDIPCNNWLNFSSRLGALDLHAAIRSNDIWWGWSGVNAFEWSALQEIMAGMLGLATGALHFSTTSLHLYDQHWGRADRLREDVDADLGVVVYPHGPRFDATAVDRDWDQLEGLLGLWMYAEEAIREGDDPESTERLVEHFPEPMLKSWLRVLQWWWSGDREYLGEYRGTSLYEAMKVALQPKRNVPQVPLIPEEKWDAAVVTPQWQALAALHAEKHAAYGDSWKRRGEMLGILANIARKVDRLEAGTSTSDEALTDTAADLLIYAIKYRLWLMDHGAPNPTDVTNSRDLEEPERVGILLQWVLTYGQALKPEGIEGTFKGLEAMVSEGDPLRWRTVETLIAQAHGALNKATWVAGNATRQWKGYEA